MKPVTWVGDAASPYNSRLPAALAFARLVTAAAGPGAGCGCHEALRLTNPYRDPIAATSSPHIGLYATFVRPEVATTDWTGKKSW